MANKYGTFTYLHLLDPEDLPWNHLQEIHGLCHSKTCFFFMFEVFEIGYTPEKMRWCKMTPKRLVNEMVNFGVFHILLSTNRGFHCQVWLPQGILTEISDFRPQTHSRIPRVRCCPAYFCKENCCNVKFSPLEPTRLPWVPILLGASQLVHDAVLQQHHNQYTLTRLCNPALRVPGFQYSGSIPVFKADKKTTQHFQTQRLKPNKALLLGLWIQ